MEKFLQKRTLTIFWIVLAIHCVFQFFVLPYRAITKPLLVPLLLLYLMLHDPAIGKPKGKFIFYVGLFLAFFGDVLLIIINETFFLSGMIAFMLMNLCYSISFLYLNGIHLRKILSPLICLLLLVATGCFVYRYLAAEMGDYRVPAVIYIFTVIIMITLAVNVSVNKKYREIAWRYLVPGAVIFLFENILLALNWFHFQGNKNVYIIIMALYGTAQCLMAVGILKAYPPQEYNAVTYPR